MPLLPASTAVSRPVRPFVRLKLAASLDGTTALQNGQSQWITSPEARADGHRWRAAADGILTGVGTVLADNPRLDVRLPVGDAATPTHPPPLIVLDSGLRTPADAALFGVAGRKVHLLCRDDAPPGREADLRATGAAVHRLPATPDETRRIDLGAALAWIAQAGIATRLHVEAGATLAGTLLQDRLVDELLLYLAPTLLGPGRGLAAFGPLATLADGVALEWQSVDRVGPDLRIVARVRARDERSAP